MVNINICNFNSVYINKAVGDLFLVETSEILKQRSQGKMETMPSWWSCDQMLERVDAGKADAGRVEDELQMQFLGQHTKSTSSQIRSPKRRPSFKQLFQYSL